MHAAKTPFSGRASLTGKRVGWRHSYNLIPAEQRDFTLVECVRPERCTEQVQNGELDFFLDEPDELEKQRAAKRTWRPMPIRSRNCRPARSPMTFADSASGSCARSMTRGYGRWRRPASCGALPALEQRGARRRAGPFGAVMRRSFPPRSLSGACAAGMKTPRIRPSFPPSRTAKEVTSMIQFSTLCRLRLA